LIVVIAITAYLIIRALKRRRNLQSSEYEGLELGE